MKVQLIVQVINKIWTYQVFWPEKKSMHVSVGSALISNTVVLTVPCHSEQSRR